MDFLVSNNVDFQFDPSDGTYMATIKIVNKPNQVDNYQVPPQAPQPADIINGLDQMRLMQHDQRLMKGSGGNTETNNSMMLQN